MQLKFLNIRKIGRLCTGACASPPSTHTHTHIYIYIYIYNFFTKHTKSVISNIFIKRNMLNSNGDSASPWKMLLWIFTSAKLCPLAINSALLVCMVCSIKCMTWSGILYIMRQCSIQLWGFFFIIFPFPYFAPKSSCFSRIWLFQVFLLLRRIFFYCFERPVLSVLFGLVFLLSPVFFD